MSDSYYLHSRVCSEVIKWYLNHDKFSFFPSAEMFHSCAFHGTSETDLVNFSGSVSFEICKFGHEWSALLKQAKTSSLILLFGAGGAGVIIYLWNKEKSPPPYDDDSNGAPSPRRKSRFSAKGFFKWLFDEELVEDCTDDPSTLHGRYFGPQQPLDERLNDRNSSSNDADASEDSDDHSLNSISPKTKSPKKFLKRPLFDINQRGKSPFSHRGSGSTPFRISNPCPNCVKGTCRVKKHQRPNTSSSTSSSSGSPLNRYPVPKTSTPEYSSENEQVLHRGEVLNRLHKTDGLEAREGGDGSYEMCTFDEYSKYNTTPVGFLKDQYFPSAKLYGNIFRGTPDGRDRWSLSPSKGGDGMSPSCGDVTCTNSQCYGLGSRLERDDSMDSLSVSQCSISGSMMDMVQNAKEVRRLIRAASFDSTASDMSLEFSLNDNLGASTAGDLDRITNGLSKLIDNCGSIEDGIDSIPFESQLVSSKSTATGLSQFCEDDAKECSLTREGSIPDLRALQKSLRFNKTPWKLTGFSSANESDGLYNHSRQASVLSDVSLEWESPQHGWHDVKPYKMAISDSGDDVASCASFDQWEWDNDCYIADDIEGGADIDPDDLRELIGKYSWLPDMEQKYGELDMESELQSLDYINRSSRSRSSSISRSSSMEREMALGVRHPPSGRSSVDRESLASSRLSLSSGYQTIESARSDKHLDTSQASSIALSSRLGRESSSPKLRESLRLSPKHLHSQQQRFRNSWSSDDSGLSQDLEGAMETSVSSSILTASINLSPVKEAREPASTPSTPSSSDVMAITCGAITTTDTVIKICLDSPVTDKAKVSTRLFQEEQQLNRNRDTNNFSLDQQNGNSSDDNRTATMQET